MRMRRSVVVAFAAIVSVSIVGAIGGGPRNAAAAPPVKSKDVRYLSIPGVAFFPTSASNYSNAGYITADPWAGWRWALSANPNLTAPIELPDGARIVSLTVNYRDTSGTGYTLAKLYEYAADHYGDGAPFFVFPDQATTDCDGATGLCSGLASAVGQAAMSADLSSDNLLVDNQHFQYTISILTHDAGPDENDGGEEAINSVIVGYVLPPGHSAGRLGTP
jgi:hypothetical protein